MDNSALREKFRRDGIVVLDGVLAGSALESFREQVSRELTKPCIPPESGTPEGVRLSSPETWPRGSQRRVIEVVPPGVGEHWGALAASPKLRHALDALLGADAWELPSNQPHGGPCAIRHWYCPVVFPETPETARGATSADASSLVTRDDASSWRRGDVGKCAPPWSPEEDAVLYASRAKDLPWECVAAAVGNGRTPKQCRERHQPPWTAKEDAALLELCAKHAGSWQQITNKMQPSRACTKRQVRERAAALAARPTDGDETTESERRDEKSAAAVSSPAPWDEDDSRTAWVPVNRRRVRGKGWHVDIGPGFDTDAARHVFGDPCQGCVALVLLSDWREGGGGTAFVAGSHAWVGSFLQSRAPQGVRHQELNAWAIATVTEAAKRGRLPLKYEVAEAAAGEKRKEKKTRLGVVDQVVGAAGSVALLHPWLVHSGTTNLSRDPRLMANGMVRVKREAFQRDGGVAVLRDLPKWTPPPETDAETATEAERNADAAVPLGAKRKAAAAGDDARGVSARSRVSFQDALASARAAAAAATSTRAAATRLSESLSISSETPSVSVVVPAHDAALWLDECFASVAAQTYPRSKLEVSAYDDASSDDTETIIKAWARVFSELGVAVAVSGSRWRSAKKFVRDEKKTTRGSETEEEKRTDTGNDVSAVLPGGIGHGKNAAVRQSTGSVLVFLDADDIMTPRRVETQVKCVLRNRRAIVGGSWRRHPAGSTEHYERWANGLSDPAGLWLDQFRETTVQMPTWCMLRSAYDEVGGFDEVPPDRGEGEDLVFFHKHLDAFRGADVRAALRARGERRDEDKDENENALPLRRAEGGPGAPPLLLYRWSPDSGTSRVSRQRLLEIRTDAFRRRVLSQPAWRAFAVWGAGRDAKAFANALDAATRRRIVAMLDVDRRKCGRAYANHRWREETRRAGAVTGPSLEIPVRHFEDHAASESARREKEGDAFRATPVVVCVAKRRKGAGEAGDLERNVNTLGLTEGETLWYFM